MDNCFNWEDADFLWDNNPYTWDEVCLVEQIMNGALDPSNINNWPPEKKKLLVKLIVEVNGGKFKESKYKPNAKIRVSDVKKVIEAVKVYITQVH
jgi:hypothetical protein